MKAVVRRSCSNGSYDADACASPVDEFVAKQRASLDVKAKETKERAERAKMFEAREPDGFHAAAWGATVEETAKTIIDRLNPRRTRDDYDFKDASTRSYTGWTYVRQAALGQLPGATRLSFTDSNGQSWNFHFEEGGLSAYSMGFAERIPRKAGLLACRELFGPATQENGDEHSWFGTRTNASCWPSGSGISMSVGKAVPPAKPLVLGFERDATSAEEPRAADGRRGDDVSGRAKWDGVVGAYACEGGMLTSMKVENGFARFSIVGLGALTEAANYPAEIRGDKLYVTDPSRGAVAFEITDGGKRLLPQLSLYAESCVRP